MLRTLLLTGLLINLILTTSLNTYAETTNNLVSQDFTTGWSGTNLNSLHGSNTVAGVHNSYIESDAVSLNSQNINKESLNEGFTITGTANYWFWSGAQQSVTQTIKTVDDNNNTLTQTRIVSGTSGTGTTYDQLIIGSNSQQDYNVSLRYDFSIPTYPNYHYAADLSAPSLTVSYTYVAPLDTSIKTELFALNTTITNDLKDVKDVEIKQEVKLDTTISKTTDVASAPISDTNKTESTTNLTDNKESLDTSSSTNESSQDNDQKEEAQSSEEKSESGEDDKSSEQETTSSTENTQTTNSNKSDKPKNDAKTSNVSSANIIKLVDVKIKDPGKILELKHLAMLDKMIDNSVLSNYTDVKFYENKKIYEDQLNIFDNRVIYPDISLASYQQKDPVFQQQKILFEIRQEKQKLLKELWSLKNAG